MFLQAMAKVMQVNLDEMAEYSLRAKNRAEITGTCAVFAESEVISHIHRVPPTPKEEIIAGIHASMVGRILGLLKRLGIEKEVAVVGGVARNKGLIAILEQELGFKVLVPENPEMVAALGAAILAKENLEK
jgi:activator of 2-hydroxyglutaryl-CoA dehydratase